MSTRTGFAILIEDMDENRIANLNELLNWLAIHPGKISNVHEQQIEIEQNNVGAIELDDLNDQNILYVLCFQIEDLHCFLTCKMEKSTEVTKISRRLVMI